jgi:hypothetical protein
MVCAQSEQYRAAHAEFAAATEALRIAHRSHEHIARATMQFAQICDAVGRQCDDATPEEIAHIVYSVQHLWDCYRARARRSKVELRHALAAQCRAATRLEAPGCRRRGGDQSS